MVEPTQLKNSQNGILPQIGVGVDIKNMWNHQLATTSSKTTSSHQHPTYPYMYIYINMNIYIYIYIYDRFLFQRFHHCRKPHIKKNSLKAQLCHLEPTCGNSRPVRASASKCATLTLQRPTALAKPLVLLRVGFLSGCFCFHYFWGAKKLLGLWCLV